MNAGKRFGLSLLASATVLIAPGCSGTNPAQATIQAESEPATPGDAAPAAETTPPTPAVAATTYSCPMHPEVSQEAPGTCPKCNMALVRQGE